MTEKLGIRHTVCDFLGQSIQDVPLTVHVDIGPHFCSRQSLTAAGLDVFLYVGMVVIQDSGC